MGWQPVLLCRQLIMITTVASICIVLNAFQSDLTYFIFYLINVYNDQKVEKLIYLLRFIEPMNLIDKKYGFPFEKALFILSLFYDISYIICLGICCR